MTTRFSHRFPTAPAALGAALLMLLTGALSVLTASPSAAHDVLVEADPAQGDVLEAAPSEVALRYNNEILEVSPAVIVATTDGEVVADGEPAVDGYAVTLALPESLEGGDYTVQWSVVSADGHRIQGEYGFTVQATGGVAGTATGDESGAGSVGEGSDAEAPQSGPTAESGSEPNDQTIGPGGAAQANEPGDTGLSELPTWLRVLIGVAAVGAVAAIVVLAVRRLRDQG